MKARTENREGLYAEVRENEKAIFRAVKATSKAADYLLAFAPEVEARS